MIGRTDRAPLPWRVAGLAAVLAAALAGPAAAQLLGGANSTEPVEIQADSGIEWQQNAQVYIARGNAIAKRGPTELHADTLIAHYRQAKPGGAVNAAIGGGSTEIYHVEALGNVVIKRDTQTVVGDKAVYDIDQAIGVVTGKGLKLTTASDVVTARDSLEWYDLRQIAVARGDASATRAGKTIKADILTAYMTKTAPGGAAPAAARPAAQRSPPAPVRPAKAGTAPAAPAAPAAQESKISRVDGQGHVVVTNSVDTGRGDFAVYNAESGIATLVGNVVIARASDVIRGQSAVMDLNNNVNRILPTASTPGGQRQRVQGLFVRESATGAAPASTAGTPPAAAAARKP